MSNFREALNSGKFVVTIELTPPKGTDVQPLLKKADMLKGMVHAVNLTDSPSSRMKMSPLAVAHLLLDRDMEPILQLTCRDRNRIALQSNLLGAYALGISNLVCMTGDDPRAGDHPDAKPVFDIDAIALLRAISSLESGKDMAGNALRAARPFSSALWSIRARPTWTKRFSACKEKIEAGVGFFQTQTVYEPDSFEKFMGRVREYNVPIIAGFIMLHSVRMARKFNDHLPGVSVPDEIIRELDETDGQRATSIEIAGRIIKQIKPMCQGVHIMPIGREARIPHVLEAAGIAVGRA